MENHTSVAVVDPLCIILVKNGSKGDRLLFRYPYKSPSRHSSEEVDELLAIKGISVGSSASAQPFRSKSNSFSTISNHHLPGHEINPLDNLGHGGDAEATKFLSGSNSTVKARKLSTKSPPIGRRRNPYAIWKTNIGDDLFTSSKTMQKESGSLDSSNTPVLGELSDKDLSNLLAVNSDLSEKKFELKINEVRFVGHPTLMQNPRRVRPVNPAFQTSVKLFHIVFCLNARASHSIVKCFYDLSKRLGIGLRHEEYRCGFVSSEMKLIISKHDEACVDHGDDSDQQLLAREALFNDILGMSRLAKLMKQVYDDVCQTGFIRLKINNWVQISFCLPQKIHTLPFRSRAPLVDQENIHRCLEAIRPYHAILLLVDMDDLIASFWFDASSTIPRLLKNYSPLKSLQTMAADADLTLSQVVEIASHLVYWAAAIVIYPMCESNVYVVAPDAPITSPELASAFSENFQGISLSQTLADFSMPMPLGERLSPIMLGGTSSQVQFVQLVCWLVKHRLLIQLHTYIYLSTYLDSYTVDTLNGRLSETGDEEGSMKLSLLPYELEEYDEANGSDSFSETTNEDTRVGASPLPTLTIPEQEMINIVNDVSVPPGATVHVPNPSTAFVINSEFHPHSQPPVSERRRERSGDTDRDIRENLDDGIERLDKFKGTLSELQESVKRAVAQVKNPLSIQDIKLFSRLSKYFTGEFHIEEIMYRENLRRSQVMLLLDKFRDVLITVEKEDTDINFFKLDDW